MPIIISEGGSASHFEKDEETAEQERAFRPARRRHLGEELHKMEELFSQLRDINQTMIDMSFQMGKDDVPPQLERESTAIKGMMFELESVQKLISGFVEAPEQDRPVLEETSRAEVLKHLNDLSRNMEEYEEKFQESGELEAARTHIRSIVRSLDNEPWWR